MPGVNPSQNVQSGGGDQKEGDPKPVKSRPDLRHRLLQKRQQQRRRYLENSNIQRVRRITSETPKPFNFTPEIPLEDLRNRGILKRRSSLTSAKYREAKQQAASQEVNLMGAINKLADSVADKEKDSIGVWNRLPAFVKNKPMFLPVLSTSTFQKLRKWRSENLKESSSRASSAASSRSGRDSRNEDEGSEDENKMWPPRPKGRRARKEGTPLLFKTSLPPLQNTPSEQTFRDVIFRQDANGLRELIRSRRDQKSLTTTELNHGLLIAMNRDLPDMVEILLKSGGQVNAFGDHNPLLLQAAYTNSTNLVRLLLHFGADPNQQTRAYTPLYYACHRNNFEMAQTLVEAGTDVTTKSCDMFTSLMSAARSGSVKIVRFLLFHCSTNVNDQDSSKRTALHFAAKSGKIRIVKALLKHGANIFVPDIRHETPFTWAMICHHKDIAELLLPADLNGERITDDTTGNKNTILCYAVKCGHVPSTQYLIEHGASVSTANEGSPFPLIRLALEARSLNMIKYLAPLTDLTLPVHQEGTYSMNALQYYIRVLMATTSSTTRPIDQAILQCLVNLGVDINSFYSDEEPSLLHFCTKRSYHYIIPELIKLGANLNIMNVQGTTVMGHACRLLDNKKLVHNLIDANFDMTLTDMGGVYNETPLQVWLKADDSSNDSLIVKLVSVGASLQGICPVIDTVIGPPPADIVRKTPTDSNDSQDTTVNPNTVVDHSPTPPPADSEEDGHTRLYRVLRERALHPRPLQEICKLQIKKHLGHRKVKENIDALPVPSLLKEYLRPCYVDPFLSSII